MSSVFCFCSGELAFVNCERESDMIHDVYDEDDEIPKQKDVSTWFSDFVPNPVKQTGHGRQKAICY